MESLQNRMIRLDDDGSKDDTFDLGIGFNDTVNSVSLCGANRATISGDFTEYNGIAVNRIIRVQIPYEVFYDGNTNTGGTEPDDTSGLAPGDTVTVPGQNTLEKKGYTFIGWNTADDGSGTSYKEGDIITIGNQTVELFAQWEENPPVSQKKYGTSIRGRIMNLEKLGKFDKAQELRGEFGLNEIIKEQNSKSISPKNSNRLLEIIKILISSNVIPQGKAELAISTVENRLDNKYVFLNDLELGDIGEDVLLLQKKLNEIGYILSQSGPGSPGNETNVFGFLTQNALIRFQQEKNISPTIGYFGPVTRGYINR